MLGFMDKFRTHVTILRELDIKQRLFSIEQLAFLHFLAVFAINPQNALSLKEEWNALDPAEGDRISHCTVYSGRFGERVHQDDLEQAALAKRRKTIDDHGHSDKNALYDKKK